MYERFTDRARKVMQLANQEAQRFNHEYIGTEHILLGLIKEGSGVAANVLKNLDVDLRKIRLEVRSSSRAGPTRSRWASSPRRPGPRRSSNTRWKRPETSTTTTSAPNTSSWVAPRAGRRGRPSADEPRPESRKSPRGSVESAWPRIGGRRAARRSLPVASAPSLPSLPLAVPCLPHDRSLPLLRVLDAAANRAREGLRVVEDYVRFVLDDQHLTELCKQLRHDLTAVLSQISDRQPDGRPRNAGGRRHQVDHVCGKPPRRSCRGRPGQFRPLAGIAPQLGGVRISRAVCCEKRQHCRRI